MEWTHHDVENFHPFFVVNRGDWVSAISLHQVGNEDVDVPSRVDRVPRRSMGTEVAIKTRDFGSLLLKLATLEPDP